MSKIVCSQNACSGDACDKNQKSSSYMSQFFVRGIHRRKFRLHILCRTRATRGKSYPCLAKVLFFEVGGGINESTNQKSSSYMFQKKVQTKLCKRENHENIQGRYLNGGQNFGKIDVDTLKRLWILTTIHKK